MGLGPLGIPPLLLLAHPYDSVQAFSGSWVELASPGGADGLVAIGIKVNSGLGCPSKGTQSAQSRIFRNEEG